MKNILLALLLPGTLTSYAKGREPAISSGYYTVSAAWGMPNMRRNLFHTDRSFGPISLTVDRQLTKRFSVGLQYAYSYAATNREVFENAYIDWIGSSGWTYEKRTSSHMVSAVGEYCYVNRGRLWMACGIGLGLEVPQNKVLYLLDSSGVNRAVEPYFGINPRLRLRVHLADVKYDLGKNFGLYGGLGFGFVVDGLLKFGVSYKFTGRM